VRSHTSEKVRHLVLRAQSGEMLPEALVRELRDQAVACGWIRASGVLADVELRAFRSEGGASGALGRPRRIDGPVHVLSLESSVGLHEGDVSVGMRAVLARESDRGLETITGEIVAARVIALEVMVTAFDDLALPRALDAQASVWLIGEGGAVAAGEKARAPAADPAWSAAAAASSEVEPPRRAPAPATSQGSMQQAPMPQRIVRPQSTVVEETQMVPEAGAIVDHFAFGRCEVLKSDGDRMHLRLAKDQRVKEIALEMLKVTPLPDEDGKPRFRLDRRL
jgi:predicted DNA-binding protein with PD1-like motif